VVPPTQLSDEAQEVWDRLAPDLANKGVLTCWDVDAFVVYCDAVAGYHEARAQMGDDKVTRGSVKNTSVKSAWYRIMLDCIDVMRVVGAKFGLTPSDRAGLDVSESAASPQHGPERLLTG
jgi:P27 family predicted phage terminase small subunit